MSIPQCKSRSYRIAMISSGGRSSWDILSWYHRNLKKVEYYGPSSLRFICATCKNHTIASLDRLSHKAIPVSSGLNPCNGFAECETTLRALSSLQTDQESTITPTKLRDRLYKEETSTSSRVELSFEGITKMGSPGGSIKDMS